MQSVSIKGRLKCPTWTKKPQPSSRRRRAIGCQNKDNRKENGRRIVIQASASHCSRGNRLLTVRYIDKHVNRSCSLVLFFTQVLLEELTPVPGPQPLPTVQLIGAQREKQRAKNRKRAARGSFRDSFFYFFACRFPRCALTN